MDADSTPIEALSRAREQTFAAGSVRVVFHVEHTWEMPPVPGRRRGGMRGLFLKGGKAVGKRLLRLAMKGFDFRHSEAEGVMDLARRRYMIDYGSYAQVYSEGRHWDGRSGRSLKTLPPEREVVPTPLWLLDLLAGVTEAEAVASEDVRGVPCRHIAARTDLERASEAVPGGVAVPTLARFEELRTLPVEVWHDDHHVRRVRVKGEVRTETVELWDFGVPVDGLDWTRLPTFRSR